MEAILDECHHALDNEYVARFDEHMPQGDLI